MARKAGLAGLTAAAALLLGPAAFAHHSYSTFDLRRDVTVKGTVKAFAWEDPHSSIALMVAQPGGKVAEWLIEGAGPRRLTSRGWSQDSLKPGDHAEIVMNPDRNGGPYGRLVAAYVDGKRIGREGRE